MKAITPVDSMADRKSDRSIVDFLQASFILPLHLPFLVEPSVTLKFLEDVELLSCVELLSQPYIRLLEF